MRGEGQRERFSRLISITPLTRLDRKMMTGKISLFYAKPSISNLYGNYLYDTKSTERYLYEKYKMNAEACKRFKVFAFKQKNQKHNPF